MAIVPPEPSQPEVEREAARALGRNGAKVGALWRNSLLVLVSLAAAAAACEAALRWLYPRYVHAAAPHDAGGFVYQRANDPDTYATHHLIRNNLGGRQSRNFTAADLGGAVNIGFFGDSMTENFLMPAQYSYTEALDHLLNAHPAATPRRRPSPAFNVLNFGFSQVGTARLYWAWRQLPMRRQLTHVVYAMWHNDLRDLRDAVMDGVVRVGASGDILGPPRPPLRRRLLSHLHLTYLALDAWRRIAAKLPWDQSTTDAKYSARQGLVAMRKLLRRWKREVEADGGTFHVAVLPDPGGTPWFRENRELSADLDILDMLDCFAAAVPGFDYQDWRFSNDPHWNPAANMLAATCLYRYLEDVLGLPARSDQHLANARHDYYQAFLDSPAWEGERYMPAAQWARPADMSTSNQANVGGVIVAKYLALELARPRDERWVDAVRAARAAGALATSDWDVYVNDRERLLVYVKSPCPNSWESGLFFLYVQPLARENVPGVRRADGAINLDRSRRWYLRRSEEECVYSVRLPDYRLASVHTGQYAARRQGKQFVYDDHWSVTFQMPRVRSVWDVYAGVDGRALDYVKKPCRPADTQARFFLHAYPLRSADLPAAAAARGHVNLDFDWGAAGEMADGACRIAAALPDFPVAFVRTGQFRSGIFTKQFWSVRIDFAEAEPAREDESA